ncbi:MAG: hypothetical protein QM660_10720 [Dysgonomonas sp.]
MKAKFEELLNKLKESNLFQRSYDWIEDVPLDIYNEYLKDNYKEVATELDVDKHRWYETSIVVIEIFGQYIGIRRISNMYSEMGDLDDICWSYKFLKMEQIQTVSYKIEQP